MANRFANGAKAFGFCDVCGFRFDLKKLKNLVVKTKQTQIKACPQCWTPDQPQLQLGMYPIADPQAIRDPRPDTNTWYQSGTNGLQTATTTGTGPLQEGFPGEGMLVIQWGWNPIGGSQDFDAALTPNTLVGVGEVGTVTAGNTNADPYFANVQLLLHMDGVGGTNIFPDSSPAARTVTPVGTIAQVQVDNSIFKFGDGSLLSNGTSGYLQTNTVAVANTVNWTVELWVYPPNNSTLRLNASALSSCSLGLFYTGAPFAQYMIAPQLSANLSTSTAASLLANTWAFVAAVNDVAAGQMRVYVNGVLAATQTNKGLGVNLKVLGPNPLLGNIDEVRVTTGVARYTSNFTPPTAAFPNY